MKLGYRQSGLKRGMPCFPGATELCSKLRRAGAEIWICTTRPYLRLDNIDPDTREWLRRNKIQYDGVLYGANKYRQLRDIVGGERIVGVLDDLPEMVAAAAGLGLRPVLISRHHNQWYQELRTKEPVGTRVAVVGDLFWAYSLLATWLRAYNHPGQRALPLGVPDWNDDE
jgi:hypothetical protein